MISLRPFNSDIISQYPYIDKVSIDEEKQVNFIYQYVKDCNIFSEHIKYFNNICTTKYLIGKPAVFPKYGNFSETFSMVCIFPGIIFLLSLESNCNLILDFRLDYNRYRKP